MKEVKKALTLPAKERVKAFELFKNRGIAFTNTQEVSKVNPNFETARKSNQEEQPVMCSGCQAFLLKSSMAKHRTTCNTEGKTYTVDVDLLKPDINASLSETFKENIISTMRNDEVGKRVKKDRALLLFGCRLFDKALTKDNVVGNKKDVRSKMRILMHLYIEFLKEHPQRLVFNNVCLLSIILMN